MLADGIRRSLGSLLECEFLGIVPDPLNQSVRAQKYIVTMTPGGSSMQPGLGSPLEPHSSDGESPACLTSWSCPSFPPVAISFLDPLSLASSGY